MARAWRVITSLHEAPVEYPVARAWRVITSLHEAPVEYPVARAWRVITSLHEAPVEYQVARAWRVITSLYEAPVKYLAARALPPGRHLDFFLISMGENCFCMLFYSQSFGSGSEGVTLITEIHLTEIHRNNILDNYMNGSRKGVFRCILVNL